MFGKEDLLESIIEVLGAAVLDRDAIAQAIIERDPASGPLSSIRSPLDRLLQLDTRFAEVTGGVMFVPAVVEGTTWTAWVDSGDAADGFVRMHPHLAPLGWWLVCGGVNLVDESGTVLGPLDSDGIWLDDVDTDVVFGPDGWLNELADGWVSVAVTNGALCWSRCETPPIPTERQATALRVGFARASRHETDTSFDREPTELRFTSGDGPMFEALIEDPGAFVGAPVAPLPDLYRSAGLVERSGIIAEDGLDWDALRSWQERNRLSAFYALSPEQVDRLIVAVGALQTYSVDGSAGLGSDHNKRDGAAILLETVLDDGEVASAFWRERARRDITLDAVDGFANELASRVQGATPVGLSWLHARCLDLSGDASAAYEVLTGAVTGSCTHMPAVMDAAGYASDRGDAATAYRLLRQAGLVDLHVDEEDEEEGPNDTALLVMEVEGFALHRPRPAVGRNDPCPCGSGRKYKACHIGREQHSLADRSAWLYDKAKRYLRARRPDSMPSLAEAMSDASGSARLYEELVSSPFITDLALHEDGVFAEFRGSRNALLPDDEALLAAQWALVDRGAFEILRVADDRLDLYDIGRGEHLTVVNTHPSDRTRVGTLMVGRPLPVGETYRSFGGFIEIPRTAVSGALDAIASGAPEVLAAFLGELFRPPRHQNTDGHDLELHEIRWRIPEPGGVDAALRDAGFQRDNDEPAWRMMRAAPGAHKTIIATIELNGNEVVGHVNSRERADMLRAAIAVAVSAAEFVDDTVQSIDDAIANHRPGEPSDVADMNDPVVRTALTEFIAELEQRWLDESIPALGGRTPRDAATDPIGRERLTHLLDSFPVPDDSDVGAMNPQRLRSALGL